MKRKVVIGLLAIAAATGGLYATGNIPFAQQQVATGDGARATSVAKADPRKPSTSAALPPAVTVVKVAPASFAETVTVTGTLVAREEILVAPEIEGLRVFELAVDEGDRVKKGQILARLVSESLDAQMAQNDANLSRSSGLEPPSPVAITGSRAMPQRGQLPGPIWRTCGCMGQVYSTSVLPFTAAAGATAGDA